MLKIMLDVALEVHVYKLKIMRHVLPKELMLQ